jgi:hypothetical protein
MEYLANCPQPGNWVSVVALIDPQGTKMADDNDPFGTPDRWYMPATLALGSAGFGGAGVWLLHRKPRRPGTASQVPERQGVGRAV